MPKKSNALKALKEFLNKYENQIERGIWFEILILTHLLQLFLLVI